MKYLIIDDGIAYTSSTVATDSHALAAVYDGWRKVFLWNDGWYQMVVFTVERMGSRGKYYTHTWNPVEATQ